jgi:hypothetical protein
MGVFKYNVIGRFFSMLWISWNLVSGTLVPNSQPGACMSMFGFLSIPVSHHTFIVFASS